MRPAPLETRGEPRWTVIVAVVAVGLLNGALPDALTVGPRWLLLTIVVALLVPTTMAHRAGRHSLNAWLGNTIAAVLAAALIYAIGVLLVSILHHALWINAESILQSATTLWATTVLVFATWYWRLDAGGPNTRDRRRKAGEPHTRGAFLFPQMTLDPEVVRTHCDVDTHWHPEFIDYLFLAFTASTAFSPTDVPVLSRWAKVLMMVQAVMSLATIALLAARAVNVF